MALLLMDGFDHYHESGEYISNQIRRWWSTYATTLVAREGRFGGRCVELSNNSIWSPTLATTHDTLIVGFASYFSTGYQSTGYPVMSLYAGNDQGMSIYTYGATDLRVQRGSTILANTTNLNMLTRHWYYIEFKVVCHNTAGSYELRVNGRTVLTQSGIDTQPAAQAYHDQIYFTTGSNASRWVDDLYVLDGSGATHNDFLGNCRIQTVHPVGDSDLNEWSPQTAGDHYAMVDEDVPSDLDSTYVESGTSGQSELWAYEDLTEADVIHAVQLRSDLRMTDARSVPIKNIARLGSTLFEGAARYADADYIEVEQLMPTDPDGAAWNQANFNNALFGVKVV